MPLRRYSQRLLNPFRGVMNVIEFDGAEGVTVDGIHWDIYVRNEELVADIHNSRQVQTSDIRYGHWSEKQGLTRGPIFPSDDFKLLEHRGAIVYEDILQHHQQLPFPLEDRYECWLLDLQEQPLALLHAVAQEEDMEHDLVPRWYAGQACRQDFMPQIADLSQAMKSAGNAADYLNRYIQQCSGQQPKTAWFLRDHQGNGQSLQPTTPVEMAATHSSQYFPPYFLRESGHDAAHQQLITAYLDWLSPCLLLLQNLTRETRVHLEHKARDHASQMEKHFRLYPIVLDKPGLDAARVEASLRALHAHRKKPEVILSTDYLELDED